MLRRKPWVFLLSEYGDHSNTGAVFFFFKQRQNSLGNPQFCRKIEIPKVFIKEDKKTPYFSPALLNGSQKAIKRETKQI